MMSPFLVIICVILVTAYTAAQNKPQSCSEISTKSFNISQIKGTWWEVARNPAPAGNWDCVKVKFIAKPNNVLQINATYSNTPSYLWVNQTMYTSITVNDSNTGGYNISFVNGLSNTSYMVYKLLDTDFQNYAFICGYNASGSNSSFGSILTRNRYPNTTVLDNYEAMAFKEYADFTNGTMSLITQTPTCYAASANLLHWMVATLLAVCFALLHIAM